VLGSHKYYLKIILPDQNKWLFGVFRVLKLVYYQLVMEIHSQSKTPKSELIHASYL
jgi:hypothetical protein